MFPQATETIKCLKLLNHPIPSTMKYVNSICNMKEINRKWIQKKKVQICDMNTKIWNKKTRGRRGPTSMKHHHFYGNDQTFHKF